VQNLQLPDHLKSQRPDLNFWTEKKNPLGRTFRTLWIVEVNIPFGIWHNDDVENTHEESTLQERRRTKVRKYAGLVQTLRDHIEQWNSEEEKLYYTVKEV
jgi:hypothetical protein